jgi:hypothetical protein
MTGSPLDNSTLYPSALLDSRVVSNFITIPQTTIDYKVLHQALSDYKQVRYVITKLEQHKDEGRHIHIVVKTKQQVRLGTLHKIITKVAESMSATITGTINYQKPKNLNASIQYLKKEETSLSDHPYLEYGEPPTDSRFKPKEETSLYWSHYH